MKICVALLSLLLLVGCKKQNPMVGTWNLVFNQKGVGGAAVKITFHEDESFVFDTTVDGKTDSAAGTYKLEGKELTLTGSNGLSKTVTLSDDLKSFDPPAPGASAIGKMVKQQD